MEHPQRERHHHPPRRALRSARPFPRQPHGPGLAARDRASERTVDLRRITKCACPIGHTGRRGPYESQTERCSGPRIYRGRSKQTRAGDRAQAHSSPGGLLAGSSGPPRHEPCGPVQNRRALCPKPSAHRKPTGVSLADRGPRCHQSPLQRKITHRLIHASVL